jgi:hypothetical protein
MPQQMCEKLWTVPISARFGGNLTITTYIRHQRLRDFAKTLDRGVIRSTLAMLPIKPSAVYVLGCCAFRGSGCSLPPYQLATDTRKKKE